MAPRVSVVLATYNRSHLIERAVASVLEQSFRDHEVLVVDDGSRDDTLDVLAKIDDPRLRVIPLATNRGAAAARNVGIREAAGELVAFQDSDDEWLPGKLARTVDALDAAPEAVMAYHDLVRVRANGSTWTFRAPDVPSPRLIDSTRRDYAVRDIGLPAVLARRDAVLEAGGFDERLPRLIDMDLFARLRRLGPFVHVHEAFARYHETPGISSNEDALQRARLILLEKHADELRHEREFLAREHHDIGTYYAHVGRFPEARPHLRRAARLRPGNARYVGVAALSLLGRGPYEAVARVARWARSGRD